jgi:CTP:molybdopterin cytidylyltransferase MocA
VTVAAVILAPTVENALADTLGQARVRRLVDIAWSGGALPVIVLAPDPDGSVAASILGTEAILGSPAPRQAGHVGQMVRGMELARSEVRETTAALIWPASMVWVGAETVTSLIEAHGPDPSTVLLPAWEGEPGWPVLIPLAHMDALRSIDPRLMPLDVIHALVRSVPSRVVEMGDPGVIYDADTPITELPAYDGPPEPPAGHSHEWGADVVAEAELTEP